MKWRIIGPETWNAAMNAALDEACMEFVGNGGQPTVRFYEWSPSAVVIGYFQKIHDEVDVELCRQKGIDIVRRISGGGAMYLDTHGEVTYSLIAPQHMMPNNINECYRLICQHVIDALAAIGINTEFKPINDITSDGKKISGNALTRANGSTMVHGTLLYDLNLEDMFKVLKVGGEKISDKGIKSAEERVTCVKNIINIEKQHVKKALFDAFSSGKDIERTAWTEEELKRARELANIKYKNDEWTFRR
ncbi:MAG: lipoate--protein ligase family protein [Candidatus Aenigmarchaeota archaeon]|nr:lipoate--protein ligase family protein [Candidatus Aenigmarchaeota archaeon]